MGKQTSKILNDKITNCDANVGPLSPYCRQFALDWSIKDVKLLHARFLKNPTGYGLVKSQFESLLGFKQGVSRADEVFNVLDEDSNGRIDLGLPITGDLNDPQFSYGAIVWKAIGNVLTKIVTAPFLALGALFGGGDSDELGKIEFTAGANTLSPSQREGLKKLGEAQTTRPNLALTVQGTWAPADKTAIQNLQMRRAVATQAGEKLQPGENPDPLALNNETTQKAIEALFEKRFSGGELASLKTGFRKANPGQLEQGVAGKALGQITNLFKDTRELSDAEVNALKGKNFYAVLAQKLQDSEEVSTAQLQTLATERQQLVSSGLTSAGVPAERVKTDTPAPEGRPAVGGAVGGGAGGVGAARLSENVRLGRTTCSGLLIS